MIATFLLLLAALCGPAQELANSWGTARAEANYYRIVDLPLPSDLALETGSLCLLPEDRLAVGTRRGDILVMSGAFDELPNLRIEKFASGLDEVFAFPSLCQLRQTYLIRRPFSNRSRPGWMPFHSRSTHRSARPTPSWSISAELLRYLKSNRTTWPLNLRN